MKNVIIGPFDGEQVSIQVQDNATIADTLTAAGLSLTREQSVSSFSQAQDVELNDLVVDGETYLITGNHVSRDRKSTRLNSSHIPLSRMPSSA